MVTERDYSSVFDYTSIFKYGPSDIDMKYKRCHYNSAFSYQAISIADDEEIEKVVKENLPSVILRNVITYVFYLLSILLFPISFWICIKKVHSLERIVLMRLGKLEPIKGPGFAFILPCIDKWTRVDLHPKNFTFSTSQLLTADRAVVQIKTEIEYRVSDVLNYVLKLNRQENTLKELGLFCLTNMVSSKDQDDLESKREIVGFDIKDELNRSTVNWGLEVVRVYLHSVQVIKAAEPVDAVGTLMTALKAATGLGSDEETTMATMFPTASHLAEIRTKSNKNATHQVTIIEESQGTEDCIDSIKQLVGVAEKEDIFKDMSAKFKLEIVGSITRTVIICSQNGNVSIIEDPTPDTKSDVQLILTEDNLNDFLSGKLSPLEAYMDGKVMVTGDWSLLKSLAKVFDLCKFR